jgi:hypothetical protein
MFPNVEMSAFKLGVTSHIKDRVRVINYDVPLNIDQCVCFNITTSPVHNFENRLHTIFNDYREPLKSRVMGRTEWFNIVCFNAARNLMLELSHALKIEPGPVLSSYFSEGERLEDLHALYGSKIKDMSKLQHIAYNVRTLRRQLKISQITFAERSRIKSDHVSRIERGVGSVPINVLINMSAALYTKPTELLSVPSNAQKPEHVHPRR